MKPNINTSIEYTLLKFKYDLDNIIFKVEIDPLKTNSKIKKMENECNEVINKLNEYINDVNALKTCYEYFKSIPDMDKFHKLPMPVTEYQEDMKEQNVSAIEMWLKDFVADNFYAEEVVKFTKDLFYLFNEWCNNYGIQYKVNLVAFAVRLKRLNIDGIETKHTNKFNQKIFNIKKLREHFELNMIIDEPPI